MQTKPNSSPLLASITLPMRKLSGTEKAALVLLGLNKENLAKIFSRLREDEIKELSQAMASLGSIDTSIIEKTIEDFKSEISSTLSLVGNLETTERLLESALGKEKVRSIIEDIRGPMGKNTWDKLTNVNEELLATYLKNEHPQTISLIVSKISPITAAKVLSLLPEELTSEVMMRMLNLEPVKKEVLEKIENTLRSDFINALNRVQKRDSNEMMAEIFNNFDRANEQKYMNILSQKSPELAQKVKKLMFTFEDLLKIPAASLSVVTKDINKNILTVALKGSNEQIRNLFFSSMSKRAAKLLQEDIENLGPIKLKEVDEAQSKIINTAKELIDKGEITLPSKDGEEEYIE
jgi:flagellar motor switch protein FliG